MSFKPGDKVLLFNRHEYTVVTRDEFKVHMYWAPAEATLFIRNKKGYYFWDSNEEHYTLKRNILFKEEMI